MILAPYLCNPICHRIAKGLPPFTRLLKNVNLHSQREKVTSRRYFHIRCLALFIAALIIYYVNIFMLNSSNNNNNNNLRKLLVVIPSSLKCKVF